uniref:Selenoprotein H n=1 Tax=Oryzias latipes TaxID=8090 RepID=A0A3B3I7K2_ORYLA
MATNASYKTSTEEKKARGENAHEEAGLKVLIEHCTELMDMLLFGKEVKSALLAARPELTVVCNPEKPRRNSFEITLLDGAKETSLWTGIKKGPPRKLKFPQPDDVVAAFKDALKTE